MKPVDRAAGSHRGFLLRAAVRAGTLTKVGGGGTAAPLRARSDRLPRGPVAEGSEVCLSDGFGRHISRVFEGELETILPVEVKLISPQHIFVSGGIMHVAGGVSRTVAAFRIRRRHP